MPEEGLQQDRREVRRTTKRVFFGMDLYLLVFTGVQAIVYIIYLFAAMFSAGALPEEPSDSFFGRLLLVSLAAGLALSWAYFSRESSSGRLFGGEPLREAVFGRHRDFSPGMLITCAAAIFLVQVGFTFVQDLLEMIFNAFGQTLQYSEALNADYSGSLSMMLYAVLLGPIAEEVVYRGFVMRGLQSHGKVFAIVMSSIIFGLMHGDLQQSLFTLGMGLIFGWVAMEYSLVDSILLHIFNNGVLGELWMRLGDSLSDTAYVAVAGLALLISLALCIRVLRKLPGYLKAYFRENPSVPGAWTSIWNIWFLLFLAYSIYEIVLSVEPL